MITRQQGNQATMLPSWAKHRSFRRGQYIATQIVWEAAEKIGLQDIVN